MAEEKEEEKKLKTIWEYLVSDRFNDVVDFDRFVKCFEILFKNEKIYLQNVFDFIVGVVLNNGGSEIPIDRDGVMLIKLMNDSIIELPCFSVNVKQTDTKVSSYSIGNTTYISNSDIYRNEATYLINYKDIQKLKIGVKKIRVQTISGFVEKEYSKDKCGANLFNSFVRVINESQKAPWKRKEKIYENF